MTAGRVAVVVLAAGSASRFGATKQLAALAGRPLVRHAVEAVLESQADEVVVVVGHDAASVERALADLDVRLVVNDRFAEGMGTSIGAGIGALPFDTGAAIIALADQPAPPGVIDRLVERWREGGADVVAPSYRGWRGNPVLFDASQFDALTRIQGDRGARALIESGRTRVARVELDLAPPLDVDTPADLADLERELPQRG